MYQIPVAALNYIFELNKYSTSIKLHLLTILKSECKKLSPKVIMITKKTLDCLL